VRFLIDADLPRSTKLLLEKYGHEAVDVRDIGLRHAKDPVIARYAQDHQACLLTGDFGFADVRNYPRQPITALLSWNYLATPTPSSSLA
jgi:predicted nuclease of predicted toxin-antitoxin system